MQSKYTQSLPFQIEPLCIRSMHVYALQHQRVFFLLLLSMMKWKILTNTHIYTLRITCLISTAIQAYEPRVYLFCDLLLQVLVSLLQVRMHETEVYLKWRTFFCLFLTMLNL